MSEPYYRVFTGQRVAYTQFHSSLRDALAKLEWGCRLSVLVEIEHGVGRTGLGFLPLDMVRGAGFHRTFPEEVDNG